MRRGEVCVTASASSRSGVQVVSNSRWAMVPNESLQETREDVKDDEIYGAHRINLVQGIDDQDS